MPIEIYDFVELQTDGSLFIFFVVFVAFARCSLENIPMLAIMAKYVRFVFRVWIWITFAQEVKLIVKLRKWMFNGSSIVLKFRFQNEIRNVRGNSCNTKKRPVHDRLL